MISVRYHPAAERESTAAMQYYAKIEPGIARRFLAAIQHCEREIQAYPESGAAIGGGIRRRMLRGFPYSLVYRASERGIRILAVAHHHRHPRYWTSRARK